MDRVFSQFSAKSYSVTSMDCASNAAAVLVIAPPAMELLEVKNLTQPELCVEYSASPRYCLFDVKMTWSVRSR